MTQVGHEPKLALLSCSARLQAGNDFLAIISLEGIFCEGHEI